MSDKRTLVFAYTAPFAMNPEFVNVSGQDNGSTIMTVRTQGEQIPSKVNLPPDQCLLLGQALIRRAEEVLGVTRDTAG